MRKGGSRSAIREYDQAKNKNKNKNKKNKNKNKNKKKTRWHFQAQWREKKIAYPKYHLQRENQGDDKLRSVNRLLEVAAHPGPDNRCKNNVRADEEHPEAADYRPREGLHEQAVHGVRRYLWRDGRQPQVEDLSQVEEIEAVQLCACVIKEVKRLCVSLCV